MSLDMHVRAWKDFWSGLFFVAVGLAFALLSRNYSLGVPQRMGPAYFPMLLGGALALLGLFIAGRSFFRAGEAVPRIYVRPLVGVLAAVGLFALSLRPLGLVAATAAVVLMGPLAFAELRWRETIVLALALAAGSAIVFVWMLGLPIPLWPRGS
jgi:Tripartite tricarboxylate transporter TctB family